MNPATDNSDFSHTLTIEGQNTCLYIHGRLDAQSAALMWKTVSEKITSQNVSNVKIDLEKTSYMDTAGAGFLCHLEQKTQEKGLKNFDIVNLNPAYETTLELARDIAITPWTGPPEQDLSFVENKGLWLSQFLSETYEFITYIGQITWALFQSFKNPAAIRWKDTFSIAERAGVDALPIVALISFIVGLVMAFQAAIPMRMFGAELYVANLIGISMVRELAPLMTAIVLAGRSASAFAAEIGTMRINEEIDALTVMGLDPIKFLIVPRIIASTVMTPLLTLFANLMGMLGGALVITSMGYPIISYYNQIVSFVSLGDLTGGLVKCFVFGILIAATGCIRGYQTKSGASAVGVSTTRAVVTGIILIAIFDGIFSIIYYTLGI